MHSTSTPKPQYTLDKFGRAPRTGANASNVPQRNGQARLRDFTLASIAALQHNALCDENYTSTVLHDNMVLEWKLYTASLGRQSAII